VVGVLCKKFLLTFLLKLDKHISEDMDAGSKRFFNGTIFLVDFFLRMVWQRNRGMKLGALIINCKSIHCR
jgi:hypothetical protein